MALLKLKDIGKIYVSEGNIAVGIRGVNLEFDKGEFVAITGKSGSGKSTLLNVISGIDTYEEGELFINGEPTSHYLQPQWESYRQEYISFIFQDYNILESFTVLENVELALMHISDKRARRKRALELLNRVGLGDRIHQKGSQLSGGQKQRTVIARALAKDSPIILADEPTGNLDSVTGEEIIKLLHEISRDKLVITVTHNFEQVQQYATREIRVYDGAIESDRFVKPQESEQQSESPVAPPNKKSATDNFKKGLSLGAVVFRAKPKLSAFICIMLIIGAVAMFAVTSFNGDSFIYENRHMFTQIEGRVVVATRNGEAVGEDELSKLVADTGACDSLYYDYLLDTTNIPIEYRTGSYSSAMTRFNITYDKDYGKPTVGKYPAQSNEALLYLPIYLQPHFGKDSILINRIEYDDVYYNVCGIKYYYDNTRIPDVCLSKQGFTAASDIHCLYTYSKTVAVVRYTTPYRSEVVKIMPSSLVERSEMSIVGFYPENIYSVTVTSVVTSYGNGYDVIESRKSDKQYDTEFKPNAVRVISNTDAKEIFGSHENAIYVNPEDYHTFSQKVYGSCYKQASLFYKSDKEARRAADKLYSGGKYVAVTSDTKYEPEPIEIVFTVLTKAFMLFGWVIQILFLAFVINLCTSRSVLAFKSDMAVMRSMGIPVKIIKIGIYVRMLLSLLPAYLALVGVALLVYLTPSLNALFVFLRWWQYLLIVVGMVIITLRVTRKQIGKLFGESVKKSLKGGAAS